MRRIIVILTVLVLAVGCLNAQEKEIQIKMEEAEAEAKNYTFDITVDDDLSTVKVVNIGDAASDKPFIGITYSELTLSEAAEIGYNQFYGLHIDSVVSGSPAYYFRLREGDILMSINDDKIIEQEDLGKVISYYRVGEKVTLHIFRDGEEREIDFVMGTRQKVYDLEGNLVEDKTIKGEDGEIVVKKKKINYGDGTLAWIPSWYMPDVEDINKMMNDFGFEDKAFEDDGYFLNGFGFKGGLGKGWFLGGQFMYYDDSNSTRHDWVHYKEGMLDTVNVERKVKFESQFGGPTLHRRFIFGKHFYGEAGLMIGWGSTEITVEQKDNAIPVNFDFASEENTASDNLDNYYDYVSKFKMSNDYIMAEPSLSLGWRVTDWLSFKAEASYIYSYSTKGWKAEHNGESISIVNEPDTKMDGLRISVGPWFGF